jgi:Putative adhesin
MRNISTTSMRRAALGALLLAASATSPAMAQPTSSDGPVLGARRLSAIGAVKIFVPAGSVRVVGWDRDSLVVRGRVGRGAKFYLSAVPNGAKLGIDESSEDTTHVPADLVVYMPRRGTISAKTVSAPVSVRDVSGWIYSVSGSVDVSGAASSMDVQSMTGNIDANVVAPWIRITAGDGNVLLRGSPEDADVSTISGALNVEARSIVRGQFASVTGDIHYVGAPPAGGIFELTSHSGAVELSVPATASAVFTLSSVTGQIINGLTQVRPVSSGPHSLRLNIGRGEAQVTVRTFKGAIRLRPPA